MPKFIKPIDLWAEGVQQQILGGKIKLQCGQWVKCGSGKYSRFVCVTGKTLNVVHPSPRMEAAFQGRVLSLKLGKARKTLIELERKVTVHLFEQEMGK